MTNRSRGGYFHKTNATNQPVARQRDQEMMGETVTESNALIYTPSKSGPPCPLMFNSTSDLDHWEPTDSGLPYFSFLAQPWTGISLARVPAKTGQRETRSNSPV